MRQFNTATAELDTVGSFQEFADLQHARDDAKRRAKEQQAAARIIQWGSSRGARRLHVEAPGCIVNITKNLHDSEGREVVRVDIQCDDYSGDPAVTLPDFIHDPEKLAAAVRTYKAIDDDNRAGIKITPDRWAEAHQQAEAALVEKPYKFLGVRVRKESANA